MGRLQEDCCSPCWVLDAKDMFDWICETVQREKLCSMPDTGLLLAAGIHNGSSSSSCGSSPCQHSTSPHKNARKHQSLIRAVLHHLIALPMRAGAAHAVALTHNAAAPARGSPSPVGSSLKPQMWNLMYTGSQQQTVAHHLAPVTSTRQVFVRFSHSCSLGQAKGSSCGRCIQFMYIPVVS
jgi:hypothetical protein